jgi:hypothetical protein
MMCELKNKDLLDYLPQRRNPAGAWTEGSWRAA